MDQAVGEEMTQPEGGVWLIVRWDSTSVADLDEQNPDPAF